jgi:hypothetical protein
MIRGSSKALRYAPPPVKVRGTSPDLPTIPPLTFRGAALTAQTIRDPAWILGGAAETGKTIAALWRLDRILATNPGAVAALVRKVKATIEPTVLRTYRRIIALSRSGATPYGGSNPQWFDYPNGARLYLGGMDDPGKVLSGERDAIYVNQAEELTEDDWETLSSRATGRGAVVADPMLFGDCNPGPGDHWIMRRRDSGALTLLESKHEDNPTLFDAAGNLTEQGQRTMAVLDRLTGVRYQRLRLGLWVGAEGQYFTQWDADTHVIAPFAVPADWRVWGGFDYGYSHNTAFYLLTEHDGIVYVVGEHCASRWLVSQHAQAIRDLCLRFGRVVDSLDIVAGHDVFAQKGDAQAQTIAQQYEALGVRFRKAQIDRVNRAQYLSERLGNPDAAVPSTIRIAATCHRLIACIPSLVVDPNRPEDVLKVDADADGRGGDDPYDAMTYGLMEAHRRPAPRYATRIEETW